MGPTLQDIANYAGVSRGTVDRVVHNRPKVSAANRKKVEEALEKLKYTPNPAARSLALSVRKLTVGVVLPSWTAYYCNEVLRGVEGAQNGLREYGIDVIVKRCKSFNPAECVAAIDSLAERGVRGISICAENLPPIRDRLLALTRNGIPVVTFNSDIPECGRICYVGQDETRSGRIAGDLMAKLTRGNTRVLVVCGSFEFVSQKNRVDGFFARMAERGIPSSDCSLVASDLTFANTAKIVRRELERNPDRTGVYLSYGNVPGGLAGIREAGRAGVVRVVCHDLSDDTPDLLRAGVIDFAVDQNMYRQGATPVSILADFILCGRTPESEISFASVQIVGPENLP